MLHLYSQNATVTKPGMWAADRQRRSVIYQLKYKTQNPETQSNQTPYTIKPLLKPQNLNLNMWPPSSGHPSSQIPALADPRPDIFIFFERQREGLAPFQLPLILKTGSECKEKASSTVIEEWSQFIKRTCESRILYNMYIVKYDSHFVSFVCT